MRFIKVPYGQTEVWINVDHIIAIQPTPEETGCTIFTGVEQWWTTTWTAGEVIAAAKVAEVWQG